MDLGVVTVGLLLLGYSLQDKKEEKSVIKNQETIYNPKNLADRIKGMKNKNVSRKDKIKARLLYEQQQAKQSLN